MSDKSAIVVSEKRLSAAKKIDEVAAEALALFETSGNFAQELAVAQAISDLRVALTDEMMQPVMALMNTNLGFKTDRDPKQIDKKTGKPCVPYAVETVRECFIESKLRGFHCCGNEWNIIASGFYACKNGLKRKCETWPGVTKPKLFLGVPRILNGGAIVSCKLTWKKDAVEDAIEAEIPVRVNEFMGVDGVLGKAERKMWKRMHDRLSGKATPEGEAGEDDDAVATARNVTPKSKATANFGPTDQEAPKPTVLSDPLPTPAPAPPPEETESPPPPQEKPKKAPKVPGDDFVFDEKLTGQQNLANLVTSNGYTFDEFLTWARAEGYLTSRDADRLTSFDDIYVATAHRFINARRGLLMGLARNKTGK